MSDSEEDYMSDKFLASVCDSSKNSRPGLVHSRPQQREYANQTKKVKANEEHKKKTLPIQKASEIQLKTGLATALSSTNKGFEMLAKMGYKHGDSLGKQNDGIVEPIPIEIKTDRGGLGREQAMKDLDAYRTKLRLQKLARAKNEESTPEEYRRRMVQRSQAKQVEGDLRKSQHTCEKLDLDNGVDVPATKWFWPKRKEQAKQKSESEEEEIAEDEEEEDDFEPHEKLEMLTSYLRTGYCYCLWCGIKFKDQNDMSETCPGNTKDDH